MSVKALSYFTYLLSLAITSQSDKAEMLKTEGGCRQ
jgi:hypothetical protein